MDKMFCIFWDCNPEPAARGSKCPPLLLSSVHGHDGISLAASFSSSSIGCGSSAGDGQWERAQEQPGFCYSHHAAVSSHLAQREMDGRNQRGDNGTVYDDGRRSELSIILVGKTGAGKSATGNSILGERRFESNLRAMSVTVTCEKGQRSWNGRVLVVIDTPAIFDQKVCDTGTCREIARCITLSAPGPHALLLVTQLGRYTEEDKEAVNRVQEIFGVEAMRHMIVLFTRKEDLGGGSLCDYVKYSDNKDLKGLIQRCGDRYCAFNNIATGAKQAEQVSELIEMIQRMVQENGGRYYVSEMYLEPNLTEQKVRYYIGINKTATEKAMKNVSIKRKVTWGLGIAAGVIVIVSLLIYLS